MIQCIFAVTGFKRKGVSNFKLSLVDTNSHKVFIVGIYTTFALLVFILNSKVSWPIGFALAAGNGLGGWSRQPLGGFRRGEMAAFSANSLCHWYGSETTWSNSVNPHL